ncbi:MAG TPA: hypothetical protein H9834_09645 [Candidatus Barnesiella excrementavium]|nr:hypothetical protein [Candidatus Barnesiella excrementavium]
MSIDSVIGAGIGAITGPISSAIQMSAQAEENRKNRQYNLMLARLQNRWNLEQWQRENDYNSPTAQMARYRKAGMNPNLAYGQPTLSASSPTLISGASSSPQDMSPIGEGMRTFGQAQQMMLNMEMQKAQIEAIKAGTENTKANTEKTSEETKSLTIDNMFKAAREQSALDYQGVQIKLGKSALRLNDKQMEVMQSNIEKIAADISSIEQSNRESIARIAKMDSDTALAWLKNAREDKQLQMQLQASYDAHRKVLQELKIGEQQYKEMVMTMGIRISGMKLDNQNKVLQNAGLKIDNDNKLLQGIQIDLHNKSISFDAARNQFLADAYNGVEGTTTGDAFYSALTALLHDIGSMFSFVKK